MTDRYGIDGRVPSEKRDCTVRAFCIASGMPYEIAWLAMSIKGRRAKCGAYDTSWLPVFQANGLCLDKDKLDRLDYAILLKSGKLDNVIVTVKHHIFAIRNGVHSDGSNVYTPKAYSPSSVIHVWKIPVTSEVK